MKLNSNNNIKVKYNKLISIKEQINNIFYNYHKANMMKHNILLKIVIKYIKYPWILINYLNKH